VCVCVCVCVPVLPLDWFPAASERSGSRICEFYKKFFVVGFFVVGFFVGTYRIDWHERDVNGVVGSGERGISVRDTHTHSHTHAVRVVLLWHVPETALLARKLQMPARTLTSQSVSQSVIHSVIQTPESCCR